MHKNNMKISIYHSTYNNTQKLHKKQQFTSEWLGEIRKVSEKNVNMKIRLRENIVRMRCHDDVQIIWSSSKSHLAKNVTFSRC